MTTGKPRAGKVATVLAFAASRGAGHVTGASWAVDGGMPRRRPMAGPTTRAITGAAGDTPALGRA